MVVITDVRPYRRTKLFEISSEAGVEFLASEKFIAENGLQRFAEFDDESFELIRAKAQLIDGIRKSIEILSRKDYSRKELYRKLCDKNIPEDAAQAAVQYVAEKGYQDDFRYAKRLAEIAANSYGRRRVEQILYNHGIERETIREVIEETFSDARTEQENLDELLVRTARGKDLNDPKEKNRIYAKLTRLGYGSAMISAAISRYEEGKDETL